MENTIFKLNINEGSKPLKAFGEFYIVKPLNIKNSESIENNNAEKHDADVYKKIFNAKIRQLYSAFFDNHIRKRLGRI